MTTIYLIRHAEAEGNIFRRLQGQYDSNITPNGMKQIAALRERFADIPIDAVYSSDLTRTRTTAGAIWRPKGLTLHTDRRLREMGVGPWENLPFGWLDRTEPELNREFSQSPRTWHIDGSEPFSDYTGRFLQALEEIARRHDGQTVAIFAHGMVLRGTLLALFFPDDQDAVGHGENTAVSLLRAEKERYTYDYLNDASHLTPEISTVARQRWWRGSRYREFNMWFRDPAAEDAALLSEQGVPEGCTVRVAMLGDNTAGMVAFRTLDRTQAELTALTLLPERRGIGLAPQLVGEAVGILRRQGVTALRLCRPADAPSAQRLLERCGFAGTPPTLDLTVRVQSLR